MCVFSRGLKVHQALINIINRSLSLSLSLSLSFSLLLRRASLLVTSLLLLGCLPVCPLNGYLVEASLLLLLLLLLNTYYRVRTGACGD